MTDGNFEARSPSSIDGRRDRTGGGRRRVVRVGLDEHRYRRLEALADEVEVTVEQLAAVWLRDRIDQAAGTVDLDRVADELAEIRAGLTRLVAASGRGRAGGRGRRADGADPSERRGSLHSEIVTVLAQRGEPMTAAEIADAIRQRDEYRAPRSGHPITGAAVSRRIANPYSRSLFERRGRQVGLAQDEQR